MPDRAPQGPVNVIHKLPCETNQFPDKGTSTVAAANGEAHGGISPTRGSSASHDDAGRLGPSSGNVRWRAPLRNALFLATCLLCWFTVAPFSDLSDPQLLAPKAEGDLLGQVATVLLTGALAVFVFVKRSSLVLRTVTLPLVLTFGAFAVSAVLSAHPDVASRRIVLAMFTIFQASVLLLLPYGREHFARLLAAVAVIVLATCYFGVAFLPQFSIHQLNDVTEPALAGDWRGFFTHKNGAGAGMALLIFIGIFVYRAWNKLVGALIGIFAAVFLYFTQAKSPLNLLPIVLLLSYVVPRVRSSSLALVLILGTPILINLLTVEGRKQSSRIGQHPTAGRSSR